MLQEVIQYMSRAISALYKQVSFSAAMATHSAITSATCYNTMPKEAWSKQTVLPKLRAYLHPWRLLLIPGLFFVWNEQANTAANFYT